MSPGLLTDFSVMKGLFVEDARAGVRYRRDAAPMAHGQCPPYDCSIA